MHEMEEQFCRRVLFSAHQFQLVPIRGNMSSGSAAQQEDAELERELAELEKEDENEFYTLLNVDVLATPEEIRSAYRRLCRIYHPDR